MSTAKKNIISATNSTDKLRDFVHERIDLCKVEIAKRPSYDDDRLHWAGQVFAYEAVLREVERLSLGESRPKLQSIPAE